MYAGRVACCPLVSHGEYADGADRLTDTRRGQRNDDDDDDDTDAGNSTDKENISESHYYVLCFLGFTIVHFGGQYTSLGVTLVRAE